MSIKSIFTFFILHLFLFVNARNTPRLDSLLQTLEQTKMAQQPPVLLEIANTYWKERNKDTAFIYAEKALKLAKKSKNQTFQNKANFSLGNFYRRKGKYLKAIDKYEKTLKNNQDSEKIAETNNTIGVCYYYIGEYQAALNCYTKALKFYKNKKDFTEIARLVSNIGYVHFAIKNYDTALEHFTESALVYKNLNNLKGQLSQLNNKANIDLEINKIDAAKTQYEEILKLTDTLPFNLSRGSAYHNLATIAIQEEKYELSYDYLLKSIKIDEHHDRQDRIAESYIVIGELSLKQKDYIKAKSMLLKGWELAKSVNAKSVLMKASSALIELYAATKEFERMYDYFDIYINLKDTLHSIKQVNAIQELQAEFDTEKQREEIKALNKENTFQRKIKNWSFVVFSLILVALSLGMYSFWLRKKVWQENAEKEKAAKKLEKIKNEKLGTELAFKNRELTSLALHSYQKNELLSKIQQQLIKLKKEKSASNLNKSIDKVIHTLSSNIQLDEEWNAFKLHFEKVHPNFFNTLQNQFPKLSQTELKHCAYIKIGLSSKEIARLLNVNNSSVHVAHYRIKKKMNLLQATSLQDFIKKA